MGIISAADAYDQVYKGILDHVNHVIESFFKDDVAAALERGVLNITGSVWLNRSDYDNASDRCKRINSTFTDEIAGVLMALGYESPCCTVPDMDNAVVKITITMRIPSKNICPIQ